MESMIYSRGTRINYSDYAWPIGGRAMCSDGTIRSLKRISNADTFFSMPAAISVKGKTVTGFVMVESENGSSASTDSDPAIVKFIAYKYGKNYNVLPDGAWKRGDN
jgi:hypothetical protein